MKKLLFGLGSILYSIVSSYLLWLIFFFITPWAMSCGWLGVIVYTFIVSSILIGIVSGISQILMIPLLYLNFSNTSKFVNYFCSFVLLVFGLSSIALPWRAVEFWNWPNIIMAVSLSYDALMLFGIYIMALHDRE